MLTIDIEGECQAQTQGNLVTDCDAATIVPRFVPLENCADNSCHIQYITHAHPLSPSSSAYLTLPSAPPTMGNCCGKESSDAFSQPGRTLSSAPPPNRTSSVPKHVGGPPRTLGSSSTSPQSAAQQEDARKKAAEAAEVRRELRVISVPTSVICDLGI